MAASDLLKQIVKKINSQYPMFNTQCSSLACCYVQLTAHLKIEY